MKISNGDYDIAEGARWWAKWHRVKADITGTLRCQLMEIAGRLTCNIP